VTTGILNRSFEVKLHTAQLHKKELTLETGCLERFYLDCMHEQDACCGFAPEIVHQDNDNSPAITEINSGRKSLIALHKKKCEVDHFVPFPRQIPSFIGTKSTGNQTLEP
jgi:hypothetical protein